MCGREGRGTLSSVGVIEEQKNVWEEGRRGESVGVEEKEEEEKEEKEKRGNKQDIIKKLQITEPRTKRKRHMKSPFSLLFILFFFQF